MHTSNQAQTLITYDPSVKISMLSDSNKKLDSFPVVVESYISGIKGEHTYGCRCSICIHYNTKNCHIYDTYAYISVELYNVQDMEICKFAALL